MTRPRIAISLGDPAGVGPEITAKALLQNFCAEFFLHCPRSFFEKLKAPWAKDFLGFSAETDSIHFIDSLELDWRLYYGEVSAQNGEFAFKSFDSALSSVIEGACDALVTAPLSKLAVELYVNNNFRGHTEYLQARTGVDEVVMMLLAGDFRVVPMTRHVPISEVSGLITEELIIETARITSRDIARYEKISRPRIGVLALNPHAGDGGLFGSEEIIISRAVRSLKAEGIDAVGPLVPDTSFIPAVRSGFDAIIGMFHDQVLIPLKMAGFERGVNATLGLPFIRTSPDHGTAFDIAGKNLADPSSMIEAIKLAIRWSSNRKFN